MSKSQTGTLTADDINKAHMHGRTPQGAILMDTLSSRIIQTVVDYTGYSAEAIRDRRTASVLRAKEMLVGSLIDAEYSAMNVANLLQYRLGSVRRIYRQYRRLPEADRNAWQKIVQKEIRR